MHEQWAIVSTACFSDTMIDSLSHGLVLNRPQYSSFDSSMIIIILHVIDL